MIRSAIPSRAKREAFPRVLLPVLLSLTLCSAALAQQQSSGKSAAPADTKTPASTSAKKSQSKPDTKTGDTKSTGKTGKGKDEKGGKKVASLGDGKPVLLEAYHDWSAYMAQGKEKTCYALASPKERVPSTAKRDQAYVFISSRPSENVRNEVSIIMGFAMKDNSDAKAEIGSASYELIGKGTNAWIKNAAKEPQFVDDLKKGSKLIVKAPFTKGNVSTDTYSLAGLSQALDRVHKECQ
jgi:invasion protein IalB